MFPTCLHPTVSRSVAGSSPRVGVLALQGDVREHAAVLDELGATVVEVKKPAQLRDLDALIIPGGESSVIDKLSRIFGLSTPLMEFIRSGKPVLGTCAGLILLSNTVEDAIEGQQSFGGLDVVVRRNAFGAQVDSFEVDLEVPAMSADTIAATFIRAPIVEKVGEGVEVLAELNDGRIVAVKQGNVVGISFHPEINGETAVHEYLLSLI